MRLKHIALSIIAAGSLLLGTPVFAQGMMGTDYYVGGSGAADNGQTAQEESAGKAVWERIQAKQAGCADLKDDDFDKLGNYFMGLMTGGGHAFMDAMMRTRLGEAGEGQMHVAMGKRLSGCDVAAAYPSEGYGYLPMMQGASGWPMTWTGPAHGPSMMSGYVDYWVTTGLVWILLSLAIVALVKWISKSK